MITTNELVSTLNSLVNKEIDKTIVAELLADVCNKRIEDFHDLINLQVLRGYSLNGQRLRGIVSVGNAKANIALDFIDDKYIVKA